MSIDLHVKYRPKTLTDVCGQEHVVRSLAPIIAGKLSHSFLLVGQSGVGKTTIARIVAADLGCTKSNILEIDAATNSGVDAMRDVAATSMYKPISGVAKAIIVDECHTLSKHAWQSILKSIEEPPEFCFWFFCTTESGKVPNTVKTRSTSLELREIRTDDIFDRLVHVVDAEEIVLSDEILDLVAQAARGSLRAALVALVQVIGQTDVKLAAEILRFSVIGDETVSFLRYLVSGKQLAWADAMSQLDKIGVYEAESLRISICNYLAAVIAKSKDDVRICNMLQILQAFSVQYDKSTAKSGLMMSIGAIIYGGDNE